MKIEKKIKNIISMPLLSLIGIFAGIIVADVNGYNIGIGIALGWSIGFFCGAVVGLIISKIGKNK